MKKLKDLIDLAEFVIENIKEITDLAKQVDNIVDEILKNNEVKELNEIDRISLYIAALVALEQKYD